MPAGPSSPAPLIVLEIGHDVAVAFVGRLLVSFGARVICIEPPGGSPLRSLGNVWPALASGKESVQLDLAVADQLALLGELAGACDVVLDGLQTSGHDQIVRTHLKREMSAAASPNAVLASVTPFGLAGNKANWRSTPFVDYHAGGDADFLPPGPNVGSRSPVAGGDLSGQCEVGWSTAGTILAFSLRARQSETPIGLVHLDISKQEVLLDLNRVELSRYINTGVQESRFTKAYESGGLFHARDRPIVLQVIEDHQWRKLFTLMGDPAWSQGDEYRTRDGRRQNASVLQELIQAWCSGFEADELYRLCQEAGLPVGPVRRPDDVFSSRQSRGRGFFQPVRCPDDARIEVPWLPVPTTLQSQPRVPGIGEHTQTVMDEFGRRPAHTFVATEGART